MLNARLELGAAEWASIVMWHTSAFRSVCREDTRFTASWRLGVYNCLGSALIYSAAQAAAELAI